MSKCLWPSQKNWTWKQNENYAEASIKIQKVFPTFDNRIGCTKAELLLLKLLQLFARDVLAMKKLEIEKTKPTLIISVLKVDIIKVGLVFSISNFFITKTPLANNWRRKKIPSCSYSALETYDIIWTLINNSLCYVLCMYSN